MSAVAGSSGLPASEQEPLLRHRIDNDAGSDASKDYASVDVRAVPLLDQEDADLSCECSFASFAEFVTDRRRSWIVEDVPDHKRQLGTTYMLATDTCIQDTYTESSHRASEHCVSHLQPRHRHWVWCSVFRAERRYI